MTLLRKILNFFENFSFGVLIGFILGTLFALFLGSDFSASAKSNIVGIATVFGTLFAAGFAAFGVLVTIRQQEIHRREERNDFLRAAKAVLPLTLLELSRVMLRGAEIRLNSEYESKNSDELLREVTVAPEILQNLRDNIMYADKEDAAHLSKIVSEYQILCNRLWHAGTDYTYINEKIRAKVDDVPIFTCLQWVTNYLRIEATYSYARGRAENIEHFVPRSADLSKVFSEEKLSCPKEKQGNLETEIEAFPNTLNKLESLLELHG